MFCSALLRMGGLTRAEPPLSEQEVKEVREVLDLLGVVLEFAPPVVLAQRRVHDGVRRVDASRRPDRVRRADNEVTVVPRLELAEPERLLVDCRGGGHVYHKVVLPHLECLVGLRPHISAKMQRGIRPSLAPDDSEVDLRHPKILVIPCQRGQMREHLGEVREGERGARHVPLPHQNLPFLRLH